MAKSVLAWAAREGIQPDVVTFNTLLRPLVREGLSDEVWEILSMMQTENVKANGATFTILTEGALSGMGDQSSGEQVQAVTRLLDEMKAAGVMANRSTYAKMIHMLLEGGDRAAESVNAVLAHMWANGMDLGSHIYTMLAKHYFSRDPPDAAAVTALIEGRQLLENKNMDRVFWEWVINGYCKVGDVDRAFPIFEKLRAAGSPINIFTLNELLVVLIGATRRDDAQKVVDTAIKIRDRGDLDSAEKVKFRGHRFWARALEYGLVKEEYVQQSPKRNRDSRIY